MIKLVPQGPLVTNSGELQIAAAVDGLGLIHTFEDFLAAALANGSLTTVLDDWTQPFPGPFLYYHSRRQMPGPLRAFIDFLKRDQRG